MNILYAALYPQSTRISVANFDGQRIGGVSLEPSSIPALVEMILSIARYNQVLVIVVLNEGMGGALIDILQNSDEIPEGVIVISHLEDGKSPWVKQ